jgi:hypothetical protein
MNTKSYIYTNLARLLHFLNPGVNQWLPDSATTMYGWLIRRYNEAKITTRQILQNALTNIHLSVDLWTSPNNLAILGVVAHYITIEGKLDSSVLALKEVAGDHGGLNQSLAVMEVINDYGIASKLGYFQMDNDSKNDVLLRELSTSKIIV